MTSFFQSVRQFFQQQYDGRYFSIVLLELFRTEPDSFLAILETLKGSSFWIRFADQIRRGELNAACEQPFPGQGGIRRRADLLFRLGGQPVLFVEVKEYDNKSPANGAQLTDYLRVVTNEVGFLYVYRFRPSEADIRKLTAARSKGRSVALLRYDDIYRALNNGAQGPLANLVCRYLEDIGVGVYQSINLNGQDSSTAKFLLVQMLGMPHQTGLGRLQSASSVTAGPQLMNKLLGNVEVIGERVRDANSSLLPARFQRRFYVNHYFDVARLKRAVRDLSTHDELPKSTGAYASGGYTYFCATGTLRDSSRAKGRSTIALEVGFTLELEMRKQSLQLYAYAELRGDGWELSDYRPLKEFPSEETALEVFSGLLKKLVSAAKSNAPASAWVILRRFSAAID
ncbi:hypothetical protein AB7M45_002241 [Bradyrhizobium elkanii]|uniref:hypothetical protein n=1 Tax=Bradyrhizobium elkanii TaxID=29448 RepID=UPI0005728732|nr:hypothetical protein [Bradyrhizobium elkanii]MCW2189471.1 hypothetical protein [Bradyrhizobium elkanii]NWL72798.1 hypothetical protein [Bradyrhizobium elkanii]OIM95894.1 hypothetical protein BLN97_02765 [Bradyrhizobium elkanii]